MELCNDAAVFFSASGNQAFLTQTAAIAACERAAWHELVVVRVEGGIWHNPGFEARVDAIWDGGDPPMSLDEARKNNHRAAMMIAHGNAGCDVFVLTGVPADGYEHKVS